MDEKEKSLEELVSEFNDIAEEIRNKKPSELKKTPDMIDLAVSGISSISGMNILFSENIDKVLEKALNSIANGNIEAALNDSEKISEILKKFGIGEGAFEGEISKTVINSIQKSMESQKYLDMKSKMRKVFFVMKNLKKDGNKFHEDKDLYKKYMDTYYAFKKVLKLIIKIYRERKLIDDRVKKGISNFINESSN